MEGRIVKTKEIKHEGCTLIGYDIANYIVNVPNKIKTDSIKKKDLSLYNKSTNIMFCPSSLCGSFCCQLPNF